MIIYGHFAEPKTNISRGVRTARAAISVRVSAHNLDVLGAGRWQRPGLLQASLHSILGLQ